MRVDNSTIIFQNRWVCWAAFVASIASICNSKKTDADGIRPGISGISYVTGIEKREAFFNL